MMEIQQEAIQEYFAACTQNEWIAWAVVGVGLLLLLAGIVLLFF
jgi:uncharacterized membrane protein YcjF (UPF0283 family)